MKLILVSFLKYILIFLVVCIVFVINYLFFAWFLSLITTTPAVQSCEDKKIVYISSNGVHMDIILHRKLLNPSFLGQLEDLEGYDYIAIGWGDEGFYLYTPSWAELKISTAVIAGFLPSKTLMHVTHYKRINPNWKAVALCEHQLNQLNQFIEASFARSKTGVVQVLDGAGYRENDFFYRAKGSYTCLYTCNVWVNQALKKAQVKTAIWSPFDKGVMKHL